MNGIEAINTTSYLRGVDTEIRTEQRTDRNTGQEMETKAKTSDEEAREKRLLEDTAHPDIDSVLVGRNADGDTTKASRIGLENLKDGIVIRKDPAQETASLKKEEEKAQEKVGSMMVFTDTQVEELYYQGRISRNDYETELKRRERLDEEAGVKTEEKEDDKKNPVIEASKEEEKKEAKKASEEKATQAKQTAVAPKDSMGNKDEGDKKAAGIDENRKKLISDEIEKDNAFAKEMGQINQRQQDFSLRADAITDGMANDRTDMVIDVLDAAEKIANGQEVRQN